MNIANFANYLFDQSNDGIIITDKKGNILFVNRTYLKITNYSSKKIIGSNLKSLFDESDQPGLIKKVFRELHKKPNWQGEVTANKRLGTFSSNCNFIIKKDNSGKTIGIIITFQDLSFIQNIQKKLLYLTNHHEVTGLGNKTMFYEKMSYALELAKRGHKMIVLLLVNLHQFRIINQTFGHKQGDELLKYFAKNLVKTIRKMDVVSHLEKDEFAIILNEAKNILNVQKVCSRIMSIFEKTIHIDQQEVRIHGNIGVSIYPHDGEDVETLLKKADTALSQAKKQGANIYQLYSEGMFEKMSEYLQIQNNLHKAILNQEFILYYQPKVDISNSKITGVEALIRWNHPKEGIIFPDKFISIAEETELIFPIGEWVLRKACEQNKMWQVENNLFLSISVNISVHQLKEDLPELLQQILQETGLDAQYLELELTEHVFMQDIEKKNIILQQIKELGIQISIDDFGTGYSSLNYLKQLPVNSVKIDRSFLVEVPHDENHTVIVSTIIMMAGNLKLYTIAEGVENKEHETFLKQKGCTFAQGYYYSKPITASKFLKFYHQYSRENTNLNNNL